MISDGSSSRDIAEKTKSSLTTISKCRKEMEQKKEDIHWSLSMDDQKKLEILKNLTPKQIEDILYYNAIAKKNDSIEIKTEEVWHARFWAIGDTHLWSKHCNYEWLKEYYDICKKKWVKTVLHAWDMVDGFGVYKWQTFELSKHSMDEQIQDVVENYPKIKGIDTYFLCGNHDEAWLKLAWHDIGKTIWLLRQDLHYLWFYNARVKLNGVDIELHHGGGGNSYSWSYKPQKYLENCNPKDQPHVYLLGHFHTALYMFYRKIHALMVWAFQEETLLSKRFKLGNTQGWRIVDVSLDNKGWTIINLEFISV